MTLTLKESIAVNFNDGDKFIEGAEIFTDKIIIIDFVGSIPITWEYIGQVFRLLQINGIWTIAESRTLVPGKPNQIEWNDGSTYRLAYRLVKYIKPGTLEAYSFTPSNNDAFALVAFSGDYNDLENKPATLSLFNEYKQQDPPLNPVNGDIWYQTDFQRPMIQRWTWYADKQSWVGPLREGSGYALLTETGNLVGCDIAPRYSERILVESILFSAQAIDSDWSIQAGVNVAGFINPALASYQAATTETRPLVAGFTQGVQYLDYLSPSGVKTLKAGFKPTKLFGNGSLSILASVGYRQIR